MRFMGPIRNRCLSTSDRIWMLQGIVALLVLVCFELHILSAREQRRIEVFDVKLLKGMSMMNEIRNRIIQESCG